MPIKNNLSIYANVYYNAVEKFGLWDQIVVDAGKEFYLTLFIQDYLRGYRIKDDQSLSTRLPYRQIKSTENNRIERIWVETNQRVTYPFKYACRQMEEKGILDTNNLIHAFTMSYLLKKFVAYQLELFIQSWNFHPIPKAGIPHNAIKNKKNYRINYVPGTGEAVDLYKNVRPTAQFKPESPFVKDIVAKKGERDVKFEEIIKDIDMEQIIIGVINYNFILFRQCFLKCIEAAKKFI